MLTHVVMFKLAKESGIDPTIAKLRSMADQIPSLRHIEVGKDISRGGNSFDLILLTKFDDAAGLKAYDSHPKHKEIVTHMQSSRRICRDCRLRGLI